MLLFKDIISNDEMASDAFDLKEIDDALIEIDGKLITISQGGDIDIGANASAEEAGEDLEDGAIQVINVVYSFRLQQTSFDKKSYTTYIKAYLKAVEKYLAEHKPERVEPFKAGATKFVKKVLSNFNDYEFYVGESMNPEGAVALLNYRDDGVTPYFTLFKDGLITEKIVSACRLSRLRACRRLS
nr:hypothetical protein HK105_001458 [Polyrhizophydium stewartii]